MPIEIKELVIRTTVVDQTSNPVNQNVLRQEFNALKNSLLEECKMYVNEKLREQKRR